MEASTIHHRLDLVVQLVDTTTGVTVEEQNVQFFVDDKQCWPISRGGGNFVFINTGRRDNTLTIKVSGYEDVTIDVVYDKLDSVMPLKQVFLIPSEKLAKGEHLCSLTGTLQGLEEIEAVSLSKSNLSFSEFNEKKCLLKLFLARGRLSMENVHYGLISENGSHYEHFEVAEELPPNTVKLKEPLKETFTVNSPIARVIFGSVSPDGSYLLRVRDDADNLKYLVCYRINGEERFQIVDFHQCRENELQTEV
ncbi:MAG: hypothetical protein PUD20_08600 [bacterium]|nr:hypothetical protein [bacterium]